MPATYTNLKKLRDKHGEIEFQAEVPVAALETYLGRELAHAARDFELPGFRKGKVPEHLVREHLNEMALLEAAAEAALHDVVREIITDESLAIVGSPRLTITKIAPKNPLEFKVTFARYPEIKLPDYKKIGKEIATRADTSEVTEKDVNDATERLLQMMGKTEGSASAPALTDEFVGKLGPFKTVAEFKEKLKENLAQDKAMQAKEAKREEIMHEITKQAKVEIPELLLDEEWYTFEERRNAELEAAKIS